MLVRTIHKHGNGHGDVYEKSPGKQYELPDNEAEGLIDAGLVEKVKEKK